MSRKTISIANILERINHNLLNPKISLGEKKSLCMMIEAILMETRNYKGYSYNFIWVETDEVLREVQTWDRQYHVSNALLPEYVMYREIREKNDGFR